MNTTYDKTFPAHGGGTLRIMWDDTDPADAGLAWHYTPSASEEVEEESGSIDDLVDLRWVCAIFVAGDPQGLPTFTDAGGRVLVKGVDGWHIALPHGRG